MNAPKLPSAHELPPCPPKPARRGDAKFNAPTTAAICEMISRGLSIRRASAKLHIHHSTIARWRTERAEFDDAINAAEAQFVENQLTTIREAAVKGSWQAAAWLLERRLPAEFSQPQVQLSNHFAIKADFNIVDNALALLQASPEAARALAGFERKTLNLPEQANEATIPK